MMGHSVNILTYLDGCVWTLSQCLVIWSIGWDCQCYAVIQASITSEWIHMCMEKNIPDQIRNILG